MVFLNTDAKAKVKLLDSITRIQAIWRGQLVKRRIKLCTTLTAAAAKIQAVYRRYRVLKWIHEDDDDGVLVADNQKTTRNNINITPESLDVMDQLCGFYSPEKTLESDKKTPRISPDSTVIIRAMQLEIKRLQRMVSKQAQHSILPEDEECQY